MDCIEKFRARMAREGIVTDEQLIPDGVLHRFHVNGDKPGIKDGFYSLHFFNDIYSGMFEWWRHNSGEHINWCSKRKEGMSLEEQRVFSVQVNKSKQLHEEEKRKKQSEASVIAKRIWNESKLASDDHPYLIKKGVGAFGLRVSVDNKLIVPMFGADKQLHTLQFISPEGEKRFLSGGMMSGSYFPIGRIKNPTDKVYIGEGYATCMTLYQATDCAIACAFNCGNLLTIARTMKEKYPESEIIIAADNDLYTPGNPGITKAKQAAASLNVKIVYPDFTDCDKTRNPTDFNDLMRICGIEEVKKQLECFHDINDDWPELEPIQSELLPVESLSIELIPRPFVDFVVDEANRMQCPIDFIAISILEVVSAIVGAGCGVKPKKEDDWLVVPNLWGCIIGRPGKLKTPAASSAIGFLDKLEADEKLIFDEEMRKYEIERESVKAEKDAIKKEISSSYSKKLKKDISPSLTVEDLKIRYSSIHEPAQPKRKRFKSNDATVEKLSELLAENLRGLLLYRDELMGLLTTWDKIGHESDRAFFLEAWNGKGTHTTDRIGRGTIDTGNMCVSVFGTTQPDKLIRYLSGAMRGNNDGLLQRFQLLIYPDDIKWELVDKKPNQQARIRAFNVVKSLASMDFSKHGGCVDQEDGRVFFRFSKDAQELFYEWLTDLEKNKLVVDDHHLLLEHFSKYRKLMPALALLFHLIDLADGKQSSVISIDNAARACALCDYLEAHARRIYALVTNVDTFAAAILAKKITDGKLKNNFTLREVYRQKGFLKDRETAKSACNELVELGWLREIETPPAKGQKRKISYQINPRLKGDYHE